MAADPSEVRGWSWERVASGCESGLRGRRAHRGIAVRTGGARGAVRHGRRRRRDPVTAKIGPRGSMEGLRACVPSHESRASRATGGVWGRARMPSDVCARRSCATRSSEAEIAPSRLCQLYRKVAYWKLRRGARAQMRHAHGPPPSAQARQRGPSAAPGAEAPGPTPPHAAYAAARSAVCALTVYLYA